VRRVATVTLVAGLVVGLVVALLSPTASAATAGGFWRSAGLRGVDAFGVYRVRPARVRLSFLLKDRRKDGYSAAVRFTFTERHHRRSVRFRALHGDRAPARWRAVRSANTGHLYVQECVGTWRKKGFRFRKCGERHRRY
jgi:hypothetical protein